MENMNSGHGAKVWMRIEASGFQDNLPVTGNDAVLFSQYDYLLARRDGSQCGLVLDLGSYQKVKRIRTFVCQDGTGWATNYPNFYTLTVAGDNVDHPSSVSAWATPEGGYTTARWTKDTPGTDFTEEFFLSFPGMSGESWQNYSFCVNDYIITSPSPVRWISLQKFTDDCCFLDVEVMPDTSSLKLYAGDGVTPLGDLSLATIQGLETDPLKIVVKNEGSNNYLKVYAELKTREAAYRYYATTTDIPDVWGDADSMLRIAPDVGGVPGDWQGIYKPLWTSPVDVVVSAPPASDVVVDAGALYDGISSISLDVLGGNAHKVEIFLSHDNVTWYKAANTSFGSGTQNVSGSHVVLCTSKIGKSPFGGSYPYTETCLSGSFRYIKFHCTSGTGDVTLQNLSLGTNQLSLGDLASGNSKSFFLKVIVPLITSVGKRYTKLRVAGFEDLG